MSGVDSSTLCGYAALTDDRPVGQLNELTGPVRSPLEGSRRDSARCLAPVGEVLPELDAVAFRVEDADELALPLGV